MIVRTVCFAVLNSLMLTSAMAQTCVDEDGNPYGFVQIGTQYWMSENLRTTKFQNGDLIPNYTLNWATANVPAWCWQQDDSMYDTILGKLYNHYAVADTRNICPEGWHVPTDGEFAQLINAVGSDPGGKLKATGTIESNTGWWTAPNTGATDDYGFAALGGGYRDGGNGTFMQIGIYGMFHALTPSYPAQTVLYWFAYNNTWALNTDYADFQMGGACRCVSYVVDWADDDGDGIPASQDPCPQLAFLAPGMPCDDGDLFTGADSVNANCQCIGLPDADADGTPDVNDVCPGGPEPGTACDDGSLFTALDAITANCQCAGLPDSDGDGTPNIDDICAGSPEPGSPCNDGNPNTTLDLISPNCLCAGQPDADGDGNVDLEEVH
jgi:uncharacterized protein (TIGR02145 family)